MIDLPLEKLADTVAALRNEVWGKPEQERRALPRIRVWAPRSINLVGPADPDGTNGAEPLEVWLIDLACGGISFISARPLDVGRDFTMTLPVMDATPIGLLCRIVHCQPAPNGSFTVGGRFLKELAEIAPAGDSPAVELRQAS
jgi:hypothetical protein